MVVLLSGGTFVPLKYCKQIWSLIVSILKHIVLFLISNYHLALNVVFFLLGQFPGF
jgi:hypothetical protein